MLTEERHQAILNQLNTQGIVRIQQLMSQLDASASTIRRDLAELEAIGALHRIHGGAEKISLTATEPSVHEKASQDLPEKQAIARYAASLIQPNMTVFLDAGTTTAQLIPLLNQANLTVVTTGVDNASLLAETAVTTIIPGGRIKAATKATVGAQTVATLEHYHFDLALIGTNAISLTAGLTTPDAEEAQVKQVAMAHSNQALILASHTKFDKVSFATFAALNASTIITTKDANRNVAYTNLATLKEVPF